MPLPVLPGVLRCTAGGLVSGGGRWANTWHIRAQDLTTPTEAEVLAIHVILAGFYVAAVLPKCRDTTTLESIDYTPLDGSSGAFNYPVNSAGAGTAKALPPECAEVLTIRTAARGRQNRGRIFIPAWTVNETENNGQLVSAVTIGFAAAAEAMNVALGVIGAEVGVGSYGPYRNPTTGVVSVDPLVNGGSSPHFSPVTAFTMDVQVDVQRSRKT